MSKKILSFVLILAIMTSTVIFTGMGANAEETVSWKVGDQPFAVEGGRQDPVVIKNPTGVFYDDYIIPEALDFDGFTISEKYLTSAKGTTFHLNQNSKDGYKDDNNSIVLTTSSKTDYIWMSINEADENGYNPNAYSENGKSVKITTTATNGITKKDREGANVYTNSVRTFGNINFSTYSSTEEIQLAFWVKTTGPVSFAMGFLDTTEATNDQKLYSDFIDIPEAGEYFISFPIQSFYIATSSYTKFYGKTGLTIYRPEIFFKVSKKTDLYIDNFGAYALMPNFEKATHTAVATVVDDFSDYSLTSSFKVTSTANANYTWEITNNASYGTLSINDNNGDKSLVYNATTYCDYNTTNYNDFRAPGDNHIYRTEDINGKIISKDDTLAFHIYASRATKLNIQTNDKNGGHWLASPYYVVPAGESILRVPLSDLTGNASANTNLAQIRKIIIKFQCATPLTNTIGGTAGTFEIDDIAIEPTVVEGDVNGDKVCDLIDVFRLGKIVTGAATAKDKTAIDFYADEKLNLRDATVLRRFLLGCSDISVVTPALRTEKSFVEKTDFDISKWVANDHKPYPTLLKKDINIVQNAPFYYTGSDDTTAMEVKYSELTSAGNTFAYGLDIPTNYGSDSVFSFWVYTDQSIKLVCQYKDMDVDGNMQQCNLKGITIPAGESIVTIPMSECLPAGKEMTYTTVKELLIGIRQSTTSTKTQGTVYFDSFGFYDKDTTNDIGYIPAVTE